MGKFTAKLTFLWYDYFGENHTPLHRNGMAAKTKNGFDVDPISLTLTRFAFEP